MSLARGIGENVWPYNVVAVNIKQLPHRTAYYENKSVPTRSIPISNYEYLLINKTLSSEFIMSSPKLAT